MSSIGSVYGQALYDLAKEEGCDTRILEQMSALDESFMQEPEYIRLLCAANLSKEERCGILDDGFRGKLEPHLLNFMKLLTEKGYMRHFSQCRRAYRSLYHADRGILEVKAVTAVSLTEDQTQRLSLKLSVLTGKQILLTNVLDPGVLGGIRLDYDGICVDDTIRHRLDSLRNLLSSTVL